MKIAIVAAGFTPTEADELRRSINKFQWTKFGGLIQKMESKLVNGMLKKGYTEEYAKRIFRQPEGFRSYGFPESHAASFALLVYVSDTEAAQLEQFLLEEACRLEQAAALS